MFFPACRTARPHRSRRLRGGRSPSIWKLARLSASKQEAGGARDQMAAGAAHGVARARARDQGQRHCSSAAVRLMTGRVAAVPRRLSRTRWRFERRGLPVK